MTRVKQLYCERLAAGRLSADPAQAEAVERLDALAKALAASRGWFLSQKSPRGLYLWGAVGRGKSMLMDMFFEALTIKDKRRVHFHDFMLETHAFIFEWRKTGSGDPIAPAARRIADTGRVLCFDEFQVTQIADAMILERLLHGLFDNGVAFVMTSNYRPDGLYPDGLHRESILPAIALLEAHLDVVNVDAGVDYRRQSMAQVPAYLVPAGPEADATLAATFARVAEVSDEDPRLQIEHRDIVAKRRAGGMVWFDFATLCGGPRSQLDYLEIATRFHTVILSGVPAMNAAMSSEARRFTWLVDVFYDQKVKLLISAECPAERLYPTGAMAHEFVRTASRLVEMQSREYLEAPRRGVAETLV
jgi:cell division protein ZapE